MTMSRPARKPMRYPPQADDGESHVSLAGEMFRLAPPIRGARPHQADDRERPGQILLVDDDEVFRSEFRDCFNEFAVVEVPSGEAALDLLHQPNQIQLILLDIRLSHLRKNEDGPARRIDGLETCRRLKADAALRDIPVIFMTALAETAEKVRGFAAGGVDYITKPFQLAEVRARLNTHLAMHAMQEEVRMANIRLQQAHDGLEQRVAERTRELARSNRMLRALSECNLALVRATDEADLLREICRIVVEFGGYPLAWVGAAEDDANKTVRPITYAGNGEGYLDSIRASWADTGSGQGPTGRAIRSGEPEIVRDIAADGYYTPWREETVRRGLRSAIAVPLRNEQRIWGALNIYAAERDAFQAAEVELLAELSGNLAYGIMALRTGVERRQAEERIREMNEKLLQANRELLTLDELKNNLMANISHELRTPLVSVRGYAEMMLENSPPLPHEQQCRYLQVMLRNIDRLSGLFDNLLDFARQPDQTLHLTCSDFALDGLLQEICATLRPRARQLDLAMLLLPVDCGLALHADQQKMRQALLNIVDNSLKFTPPGGRVTLGASASPGAICITIADTGIGISAENQQRIFTRFYQVDGSMTRRYGGVGLGLTIAHEIIARHDGTIAVQSRPGQGTEFIIRLPHPDIKQ